MKLSRKDMDVQIHQIIGKKKSRLNWCYYEEFGESSDLDYDEDGVWDNEILEMPFDSFDQIFHEGRVLFKHCGYWSNAKFVRKTNPTWRDVIVIAEKFASGDHIFLESICGPKIGKDGIVEFSLGYGS